MLDRIELVDHEVVGVLEGAAVDVDEVRHLVKARVVNPSDAVDAADRLHHGAGRDLDMGLLADERDELVGERRSGETDDVRAGGEDHQVRPGAAGTHPLIFQLRVADADDRQHERDADADGQRRENRSRETVPQVPTDDAVDQRDAACLAELIQCVLRLLSWRESGPLRQQHARDSREVGPYLDL